jgi:hypothetical protein
MPRSYQSFASDDDSFENNDHLGEITSSPERDRSPVIDRNARPGLQYRSRSDRTLDFGNLPSVPNESSSLLDHSDGALGRSYRSFVSSSAATPRPNPFRANTASARFTRHHSRKGSFSQRLVTALGAAGTHTPLGTQIRRSIAPLY